MANPLYNPNLWQSIATGASAAAEYNSTTTKYQFATNSSNGVGLTYNGPTINDVTGGFAISVSNPIASEATITITIDGGPPTSWQTDASGGLYYGWPNTSFTTFEVQVTHLTGASPYAIFTVSDSVTVSATPVPSATPLVPSPTPVATSTPTPTASLTVTPSLTVSPTMSVTPTASETVTPSPTVSLSATITPTPSITVTPSVTLSPSGIVAAKNILQLLRRYSDGTLVAKSEVYDGFYGFQHKQLTVATEWMIQHNVGKVAMYDLFDENNEKIIPSEIVQVDNCNLIVKFNTPQAGFINIVFLVNEQTQCVPPTPSPSITPSITPSVTTSGTSNQPYNSLIRLNVDGTIDQTYQFQNITGGIIAMGKTSTGKLYAAGFTNLYRLNSDGTYDYSYTPMPFGSGSIKQIYQTADGKIYVIGNFLTANSNPYKFIARLNSDGTLDTTFTPPTLDGSGLTDMYQTADGKIYLAGYFTTVNGNAYTYLARFNSNFTLDTTFANPAMNYFYSGLGIMQAKDSSIYIGGDFNTFAGNTYNGLARLHSDGTIDTSFTNLGMGGGEYADIIVQTLDSKIYPAGFVLHAGGNTYTGMCRLNSDGTIDNSYVDLQTTGISIEGLMQTSYGKMYINSNFLTTIGGHSYKYVARLNSDATVDTNFVDLNLNLTVYGAVEVTNGKVLLYGQFYGSPIVSPTPTPSVTKSPTTQLSYDQVVMSKNPIAYWPFNTGYASLVGNNTLTPNSGIELVPDTYGNYTYNASPSNGASFASTITLSSNFSLEAWIDLQNFVAAPPSDNYFTIFGTDVYGLQFDGTGKLFMYGNTDAISLNGFTIQTNHIYHVVVTVDSAKHITYYINGTAYTATGPLTETYNFKFLGTDAGNEYFYGVIGNPAIYNTVLTQQQVLDDYNAGIGNYRYASAIVLPTPSPTPSHAGVSPTPTLTPTITPSATATVTPTVTPTVTASVTPSPSIPAYTVPKFLARLTSNGTLDSTFTNVTLSNSIGNTLQTADGKIYICNESGAITVNGTTYNALARLNSDGSFDSTFAELFTSTGNPAIYAAKQAQDGKIYIGGRMTTTGTTYNALARLNSNGTLDTTFTGFTFDTQQVDNIMVSADGKIYVTGNFTTVNGNSVKNVFRLNSDGTYDTTFTTAFTGRVYIMAQDSTGKIWCNAGNTMIRLNSDGTLDNTMTALSTDQMVSIITPTADGKIYIGTTFLNNVGGNTSYHSVVRLTSAGIVDTTFTDIDTSAFNTYPDDIIQTADGKIYISGTMNANTNGQGSLIRLNSDGTKDTAYTLPFFDNETRTMRQTADGKIYVGGDF